MNGRWSAVLVVGVVAAACKPGTGSLLPDGGHGAEYCQLWTLGPAVTIAPGDAYEFTLSPNGTTPSTLGNDKFEISTSLGQTRPATVDEAGPFTIDYIAPDVATPTDDTVSATIHHAADPNRASDAAFTCSVTVAVHVDPNELCRHWAVLPNPGTVEASGSKEFQLTYDGAAPTAANFGYQLEWVASAHLGNVSPTHFNSATPAYGITKYQAPSTAPASDSLVFAAMPTPTSTIPVCTITVPISVTAPKPTATLIDVTQTSFTVVQGLQLSLPFTVDSACVSSAGDVGLSCLGLPVQSGLTCMSTPISGCAGGSLILTAAAMAPAGITSFTIHAESSKGVQDIAAQVKVSVPGITMTLVPAALVVPPGQSGRIAVVIKRTAGVNAAVGLSVTGLPPGVTAGAASIAAGAKSALVTLTAASGASTTSAVTATVSGDDGAGHTDSASLAVTVAASPPGGLDATLCGTGTCSIDVGANSDDEAAALAQDSAGNFIVGGTSIAAGSSLRTPAVMRFLPTGAVDTTWGTSGRAVFSWDPTTSNYVTSVLVTAGKVLVVGYAGFGSNRDFQVARLNGDGTVDTSYGVNGLANLSPNGGSGQAFAAALQPDGKLVVVGTNGSQVSVARYLANGTALDTTFGTAGVATFGFGGYSDMGRAVVVQSDGKLLVVGGQYKGSTVTLLAFARLNADGTLDSSLGSGGKVVTTSLYGSNAFGYAVALQANGGFVIAGSTNILTYRWLVARFTATGAADTTFNATGIQNIEFGGTTFEVAEARGVAFQSDGKIVAAGFGTVGGKGSFAVARLSGADGALDSTYQGPSGRGAGAFTVPASAGIDRGAAMLVQSDGKLVIAGTTGFGSGAGNFALMRLLP